MRRKKGEKKKKGERGEGEKRGARRVKKEK